MPHQTKPGLTFLPAIVAKPRIVFTAARTQGGGPIDVTFLYANHVLCAVYDHATELLYNAYAETDPGADCSYVQGDEISDQNRCYDDLMQVIADDHIGQLELVGGEPTWNHEV